LIHRKIGQKGWRIGITQFKLTEKLHITIISISKKHKQLLGEFTYVYANQ
jgi:hypothetical protein